MDFLVLDNIPFQIDPEQLYKNLKIKKEGELAARLNHLVDKAQAIGRPKASYKAAFIESRGDDQVNVEGVMFTSRVLRVNLEKAHRVFPFVTTCGLELEEWSNAIDDLLEKYWADVIKEMALRAALKHLKEHLIDHFQPGKMSRMNPGSLADWPLPEQRQLFALLGGGPASIGIKLTDSFLMVPIKSVSGIWFPTEESFESCLLCPREKCPGRRAPYDADLYDKKYRPK
ncbi:MAG: vitamin B12 dependent methionine synthase [Deltaproteobacteria bacterium]|nr:vitamin B12 dependent methionine synthase [Deltaproteobacteria bacterium]